MAGERLRLEYYDSSAHNTFNSAVWDYLVQPALTTLSRWEPAAWHKEGRLATGTSIRVGDNNRIEYDFYATKSSPEILIHAARFEAIDVLSDDAARLILDGIFDSDLPSDTTIRYWNDPAVFKDEAQVEQYLRYTYHIDVQMRTIRIETEMGINVDSAEVDAIQVYRENNELDQARQTIFESDELNQLTRGVYEMGLVDSDGIKAFTDVIATIAR